MAKNGREGPVTPEALHGNAVVAAVSSSATLERLRFEPTGTLRPLKDEVMDKIYHYHLGVSRPPFTVGQMIVMVLVVGDLKPQTLKSINYNIYDRFRHHADPNLHGSTRSLWRRERSLRYLGTSADHVTTVPVIIGLYEAASDFDIPLSSSKDLKLGVQSRDNVQTSTDGPRSARSDINFKVKSLSQTLFILRVSKQVRAEALPVFYGHNTWQVSSLECLYQTLRIMSNEAIRHIKDLRVGLQYQRLTWHGGDSMPGLGSLLSELSPRELVLLITHVEFFPSLAFSYGNIRTTAARKADAMSSLDRVKGLDALVAMANRAKNLEILGDDFPADWLRTKLAEEAETEDEEGTVDVKTGGTDVAAGSSSN
ncbi:hypothetical protein BST61_g5430 [Cercospora zeina]